MFGDSRPVDVELNSATDAVGSSNGAGMFTVPAEFLFHGDYKRAGGDLKIIGQDGKSFVVHDYFKNDKLPTLFAPDGAALSGDVVAALAGPLAPGQYAQATAPQSDAQPIGRVATESGGAVAIRNGVSVALNVGDAVLKGDVIQTQGDSKIGIIFGDGTTFDLGANARMVLNEFVYNPAPGSVNSALINLVQGSITFVAGAVAHTGDMKVSTPVATMGIRGTAVQVDIDVNNGTTHLSVLIEPGGRVGSFNIYSLSGQLIGTVSNANNQWSVTPTAPLEAIATETLKSPAQMQQAFAAVQQVFQVQQVGQAILAAQPVPPSPPQQQTPQNLQGPDNQTPQQTAQATPKTQIASTDVSQTTHITVHSTQDSSGSTTTATVTNTTDNTQTTFVAPPPPPPPIILAPPNFAPFFEAAPTTLVRVSATDHDSSPLNAIGPAASGDGRYVAFLGAETLNNHGDGLDIRGVFVYDRMAGTTTSLSDTIVGTTLHAGETFESLPSISADGHYIVFSGKYQATTTQGGDGTYYYEARETFIYDTHTGVATLLTTNGGDPSISADGNSVAVTATKFVSVSDGEVTTTVATSVIDILSRSTGLTGDEIAINPADGQLNTGIMSPSISGNGRYVTFETTASSIDIRYNGNTASAHFDLAGNGNAQIYIYDLLNPATAPQLVSFASGGGAANGNSGIDGSDDNWPASMSADGRYVVFESSATNLVAGGTDGHSNIYLYDSTNHTIKLISVDLTNTASAHADSFRPQISADGRYISFVSAASDLIANGADTNGQPDAFLYDTLTGKTTLISNGYNGDSEWGTAISSLNGAPVFAFGSQATNAVTPDTNNSADVFVLDNTQLNTGAAVDNPALTTLTATGTLKFVDEVGDHHSVSIASGGTHYGTLVPVLTDNGSNSEGSIAWTYTVDQSVAAALGINKTLTDTFNVVLTDSGGNAATAVVTVTIVGSDAEISGTTAGAVSASPGTETATGHLSVTTGFIAGGSVVWSFVNGGAPPPSEGETPEGVVTTLIQPPSGSAYGNYGYLQLDQSGNWQYQVFANLPAVEALGHGQSVTDTFAIQATNATGGIESKIITITVNGSDHTPTVAVSPLTTEVTQNAAVQTFTAASLLAALGAADADSDPLSIVNLVLLDANHNAIDLNNPPAGVTVTRADDGSLVSFSVDPANFKYLNDSQHVTLTANFGVADGFGGLTPASAQLTIDGVNDAAIISGVTSGAVTEAGGINNASPGAPTASGTLTDTDIDNTANTFLPVAATASAFGSYSVDASGHWSYTLNNNNAAVQQLNVGAALTDSFTVHTADGTAQLVTITINGANDAAVLSSATANLDETNAALTTGGTLTISDVDSPQSFVAQSNVAGTNGHFSVNSAGVWSYTANSAFDSLNVGDTLTDTFTVKSADNTATSVTVNIHGTNDAAVLSSATANLNETNAALTTGGTLTVSDVDSSQTFQAQSNVAGANGHFTIGANGVWSYTANSAFDNLNVGDTLTDTFTIKSADNTQTSVTVNIHGTNDAAVLSSATVNLDETNAALTTGGTLTVSDVDSAQTFQAQSNVAGTYGHFSINSAGVWSYTANSADDSLNVGDTLTDTFTVKSADNTQTSVTVNIHGTNDGPVATNDVNAITAGQGAANGNVLANDSDVDSAHSTLHVTNVVNDALAPTTITVDGAYGEVVVTKATGDYSYTLGVTAGEAAAVAALGQNAQAQDDFVYTVTDDHGASSDAHLSVTVTGVNDPAVLSSATVDLNETNAPLTTGGTLTISDVDSSQTFQAQSNVAGSYGHFSIGSNGAWSYTANSAFDNLSVGDTLTDKFTVKSADNTQTSVTVNIHGTDDAPVFNLTPDITEVPIPNPLPAGTDAAAQQEVAPVISQDGRWAAFFSSEVNPENGNNGTPGDVYLYDRQTGTTTVLTDAAHTASLPAGETFGDGLLSISADGGTVMFRGKLQVADAQSPTGFDQANQLIVYDRASDTLRVLTNPDNNNQPYNVDDSSNISGNGTHIVFDANVFNGNGPSTQHVYVTDLSGHIQTDITPAQLGIAPPSDPNEYIAFSSPDISGGGRYLTFWAETRGFGPGNDTPIGAETLYTYDRSNDTLKIVATTTASDNDWPASMSNDGRYIVFQSDSNALDVQAGGTANNKLDIFVWDRNANSGAGGIIGVTDSSFVQGDGDSERAAISPGNARYVIFGSTATNLVPGDSNGQGDAFVYDLQTHTFQRLSTAMDGTQGDGDSTLGADLGYGGNSAVFGSTAGNLVVPGDTDNGLSDIFIVGRAAGTVAGVIQGDTTPAFAGAPANSLSHHGAIKFNDADLTDTHTVQVIGNPVINIDSAPTGFVVPPSGLGTFTPTVVETAGSGTGQVAWTFTVDNAATVGLGALQQVQETYTVQLSDGHGGVVTQDVSVSIFGVDDAPTLTLPGNSASTNQGTSLALTGGHVADLDIGDVITLNLSVGHGSLTPVDTTLPAGVTVDDGNGADGTLQLHGSAAAIDQLLNDGVTYTPNNGFAGADTMTVTAHDSAGASNSKQVAITVFAPPAVGASPAHLVEAVDAAPGVSLSSAALQFAGGDGAPVHVATGALAGHGWVQPGNPAGVYTQNGVYGTATLNTNTNTISYALDNAKADPLGANDHPTETFGVPVTDGAVVATSNIVFTVDGNNDTPKFGTTLALSFENGLSGWQADGAAGVQVVLGGTDGTHAGQLATGYVSESSIESFLNIPSGILGQISAGPTGAIPNPPSASTLPLDGSAISTDQLLQAGQVLTFDWRFLTQDYSPWGDFAFFSASLGLANASVTKLSDVFVVGDYGDSGWQTGSFTVPTTGFYHLGFGVMNAGDDLVTSTLQVDNVGSGSSPSLSITEGVNASGIESDSQILTFSDPEKTQSHTVSNAIFISSDYGPAPLGTSSVQLTADTVNGLNGQITFGYSVADSAIQSLGAGQQVHEQYQINVDDGHGGVTAQTVYVTITGSDDGGVNLVANGGFETDALWATKSGTVAIDSVDPHASTIGHLDAKIGALGHASSLAQNIATTPGDHYTLDFWLENKNSGANSFTVLWNGQAVSGGAISNGGHTGYTEYQFDVVGAAGASQTSLAFDVSAASTAWNLDDVSVRSGAPDAVHHLASDTLALSGVAPGDNLSVVANGAGYSGTLSATAPANGTVAWAFDATNADINHLVGQTQSYAINDLNANQPPTLFSVSVGGAGNDQFQFSANSGTREMVNFTIMTDQQNHYVGDTIELLNISQSELNSALAGLASDVHGNAVVHFDTGDSITFQHINASIVQAQAGNIFHVGSVNAV